MLYMSQTNSVCVRPQTLMDMTTSFAPMQMSLLLLASRTATRHPVPHYPWLSWWVNSHALALAQEQAPCPAPFPCPWSRRLSLPPQMSCSLEKAGSCIRLRPDRSI
jgi:hypothetical protein